VKKWPLLLGLLLTGCMVGPDYDTPATKLPCAWGNDPLVSEEKPPLWEEIEWWKRYNDPILSGLVKDTIQANYDLKAAIAKLDIARSQLAGADAMLAPMISMVGSYSLNADSLNSTSISTQEVNGQTPVGNFAARPARYFDLVFSGFEASWEIDLFGRIRRGIESSEANVGAYHENLHNVLLSLIADVAMTYVNLRGYQQQQKVLETSLAFWDSIYRLNQDLLKAGLVTEIDVEQALASREKVKADLEPLKAEIKTTLHQLAALSSRPPTALYCLLLPPKPIPHVPPKIFAGLPSDLLKRRPDIKQAERDLAAATAAIGVAKGYYFPIFSLTGNTGYQSNFLYNFISTGSGFYSVGPGFSWPIFNFGRVAALVNAVTSRQEELFFQYKSTLFKALADVESALVKYKTESIRYGDLVKTYQASREAAQATRARFDAGKINFMTVLQADLTRQSYELDLVKSQTTMVLNSILLYKALGGGWEPARKKGCPPCVAQSNNRPHQDKGTKTGPKGRNLGKR